MAYFIAVANSELNPVGGELNGQAHNRSALKRFALITMITIINEVFPSYTKIQVPPALSPPHSARHVLRGLC